MSRNVGIIGAGSIARVMARTINGMDDVNLYAIASRSIERANAFAKEYDVPNIYDSYEAMLEDDNVDLVYIATPHSHHFQHMKMCIEYGKHILCEKAFTTNEEDAEEIFRMAKEKGVLVTEAIWTRYMPSRHIIDDVLKDNPIGKICTVTCNLSYDIDKKERLIKPELAGGALLDIGIYGLNFIVMHLGKEFEKVEALAKMTETGVDGQECITFFYNNGIMAVTTHSIYGRSDRKGIFVGESGYIIVENINNPREINIYNNEDELIKHIEVPKQITGYEYEVRECFKAIESGNNECISMPHSETIYMLKLMDDIRKNWKV